MSDLLCRINKRIQPPEKPGTGFLSDVYDDYSFNQVFMAVLSLEIV